MILAALALAAAQPDNREIYLYAFPGHDSCADWTLNRATRDHRTQALEGWVLGFVSGYNMYADARGNVAPGVSATALLGWVDQYCAANPLDSLMTAGLKLVLELKSRRR